MLASILLTQGLTFIVTKMGGLGVSVTRGRCFTIKRLTGKRWSAPCFATINHLGFGLTVGKHHVEEQTSF